MSGIGTVNTTASATAQAVQTSLANAASGASQSQAQKMGLPPARLAGAASTNTVNAQLASSQWGVDPATVSGIYGGVEESGGLFAGGVLLLLLTHLSHAHAEQALALIGVQMPGPGSGAAVSQKADPSAATTAIPLQSQTALSQAASGSGPAIVDPLWGRSA